MRDLGVIRSVVTAGLVLAALNGGCGSDASSDTVPATAAPPEPAASTLAEDISIDEIAVYQAVKTTLVTGGALAKKVNAPIIANRPAFVRVFVKALGKKRPQIEAELRVKRAGKEDLVLKGGLKKVLPIFDDSELSTTINFEIPAEDMTPDAAFSMKVGPKLDSGDVITFPAEGDFAPFNAKTASQKLRVTFVPVTYEADAGTSLTPDLADTATLKDTLYKMYPVASVEITVRAPFKWSTPVAADGPGWDKLLSGIMQLRRIDKVDRDVYYVGVFTPAPTLDEFCSKGSCILGIAPQADEINVGMRAALVLGYKNRSAGGTLAQELAHAMGRAHAPCGSPQAVDPAFPYESGGTGVWGYDVLKKELVDPDHRDFMSYCGPVWTSDYTFQGIYDRMETVTEQQKAIDAAAAAAGAGATPAGKNAQAQLRQSLLVANDGTVSEGPALEVLPGESRGEQLDVSFEGAGGKLFARAKGQVRTISGTGSRLVVLPEAPAGATHARLAGIGLTPLSLRSLPR